MIKMNHLHFASSIFRVTCVSEVISAYCVRAGEIQSCNFGDLRLAVKGELAPWKGANTTDKGLPVPFCLIFRKGLRKCFLQIKLGMSYLWLLHDALQKHPVQPQSPSYQ